MMRRLIFFLSSVCMLACPVNPEAQVVNYKRLVASVDARTIASTGNSSAATLTLTPTNSYVTINCQDTDGCTITMGESGIPDGMPVLIINISANPCTFSDSSAVSHIAGTVTLAQWQTLSLQYVTDRWVQQSSSLTERTATLHQTNAQVKAWPTVGGTTYGFTEIVAAPPSGFMHKFRWGMVVCDTTSGSYTNIDANAFAGFASNDASGASVSGFLLEDDGGADATSKVTALLATADKRAANFEPGLSVPDAMAQYPTSPRAFANPTTYFTGNLVLYVDNNGSGNFTGGHANDSCDITVGYLRIKVPGL